MTVLNFYSSNRAVDREEGDSLRKDHTLGAARLGAD